MTKKQNEPPFGTYRLNHLQEWAKIQINNRSDKMRLIASLVRRITGLKNKKGPIDVKSFGTTKVRLYPDQNLSDYKCLKDGLNAMGKGVFGVIQEVIKNHNQKVFNFVDVGANTGMFTLIVNHTAQEHNKKTKIVAVEPNPIIAERLRFNITNSKLNDSTMIFQNAISNTEEEVTFDTSKINLGEAQIVNKKTDQTISVKAKYLTSILKEAGMTKIDLLKIDVEGHEVQALTPFFNDAPKNLMPKYIFAETHSHSQKIITEFLEKNGYIPKQKMKKDTLFVRE